MKKFLCSMMALILALTLFSGCSSKTENVLITATDNGWDSQKLHNEVARLVVENAFDGYTFETSTASSTMNWQALIAGDVDIDIESWTDNVATYSDDVANGDVVDIGTLIPDSRQGLYVPRYVIEGDPARGIEPMAPDLKTVEDLKKYPQLFPDDEDKTKGRIYGALPGWMADEILSKKYEYYGLNEFYNYARLGSEATLFASLASAYNLGDAWVGYCYEPTWVSGKLDIVLLEDAPYDKKLYTEGKCEFPKQELKIVSNKSFAKKAPDLVEFFAKYQTGSKVIAEALSHIDETGASHEDTAKWMLREHDELLEQWLPKERADRVRKIL
ncbi:glycine betaine ABC transporter substrate-binding protein [Oscillospiraceae bacterium PP1C4]